jgi:radical SAM/Cys-rich protein
MHATLPLLQVTDFPAVRRTTLDTLQVNLGYKCNQTCVHCHVNAGPNRTEVMNRETVELVLAVLAARRLATLDLTGGAPELNPYFRTLVSAARALGIKVIDRCNLTILFERGQQDLADFLAREQVEVVASLPCYESANVDRQRGEGVFDKSIAALKALNARGYGRPGSALTLNLVYNPQGPVLPPAQMELQAAYQRELSERFGIVFNQLYVLANMPIQRFGSMLISKGLFASYMRQLRESHCAANLEQVMCRHLISVDWQGYLSDCDFNQMMHLPLRWPDTARPHLRDLLEKDAPGRPIVVADHCYGCTAGQGSSCGGALAQQESGV